MCYSANVSLLALTVGLAGQAALWTKGDKQSQAFALAITSVTIIQLYEYFLWKNPCTATSPSSINRGVSQLTMLTIVSQPLIILGALFYANAASTSNGKGVPILIAAAIYASIAFTEVVYQWPSVTCSAPSGYATTGTQCTKDSCGLTWQFLDTIPSYFWLFYQVLIQWAVFTFIKPTVPTALAVQAFLFGSYFLSQGLHSKQRSIGSHWCFIAICLPWLMYYLPPHPVALTSAKVKAASSTASFATKP